MIKIFISGLTAAGKTTHAKSLALDHTLQYVSASSILLKHANIDADNVAKNFWVSSAASPLQLQRSRDQSVDLWVDQQMISTATIANNVLFDSWGLPWLSAEPGLRIWLESSVLSRWWKAIVSQETNANIDPEEILVQMNKKDKFTREYFLSNYGFDLFRDYEVFDYIIDITHFISAPTPEASRLSVSKAHKLINSIVKYYTMRDDENLEELQRHIEKYGKNVFKKY